MLRTFLCFDQTMVTSAFASVPRFGDSVIPRNSFSTGDLTMYSHTFRYLLVLDFEANCENGREIEPCQEIIEFPVVLFDLQTMQELDRFHSFVKPQVVPELTSFCTELTGITQNDVEDAPTFQEVLQNFDSWLLRHNLIDSANGQAIYGHPWTFATIGDWDLRKLLRNQATYFNVALPGYFEQWINLKLIFRDLNKYYPYSMMTMLKDLKLVHFGRHHSGIDDVQNTCQIVRQLARRGAHFRITSSYYGRYPGYKGVAVTHKQDESGLVEPKQRDFPGDFSPPTFHVSPQRWLSQHLTQPFVRQETNFPAFSVRQ